MIGSLREGVGLYIGYGKMKKDNLKCIKESKK